MPILKEIVLKKLEKKTLQVKMSDNTVWNIPVYEIVMNRAKYYTSKKTDKNSPEYHEILEDKALSTVELFNSDEYEIEDWAVNNMNWSDLEPYVKLVTQNSVDYEDEWCECEKTFF